MSNITEMQAAQKLAVLRAAQGWDDAAFLQILVNFITLSQLHTPLLAYAQEVADEENA